MNDRKPTVRAAAAHDLEALVSGNAALAEETERGRLDVDTLREGIRALLELRAPGRYWVAELEGRVVGQLLTLDPVLFHALAVRALRRAGMRHERQAKPAPCLSSSGRRISKWLSPPRGRLHP